MKVSLLPYNYSFGTTSRSYVNSDNRSIQTTTYLFRDDLDWDEFSNYIVRHFKDKDKVNFIQFACSDGSETYTQIISLLEKHADTDKFFPIKSYDIDKANIKAAKSGLLNIHHADHNAMKAQSIFPRKYFTPTKRKLHLKGDVYQNLNNDTNTDFVVKTYRVSPKLTSKANFHRADMFDILKNMKKDSNTILMCRNILGHLSMNKFKEFVDLAAEKLEKGSLLVIGSFDTMFVQNERYIQGKGFVKIMDNVYRKQFNYHSIFSSSR